MKSFFTVVWVFLFFPGFSQNWFTFDNTNSPVPLGFGSKIDIRSHEKCIGWSSAAKGYYYNDTSWIENSSSLGNWPSFILLELEIGENDTVFLLSNGLYTLPSFTNLNLEYYNINLIRSIGVDADNGVWFCEPGKLFLFDNDSLRMFDYTNSSLPNHSIKQVLIDNNDSLWILTDSALLEFDGVSTVIHYFPASYSIQAGANGITTDVDNNIWFGTNGNGLMKFDGLTFTEFTVSNSNLVYDFIKVFEVDSSGIVWMNIRPTGTGSYTAIGKFDVAANDFVMIDSSNSPMKYPSAMDLAIDSFNNIWIVNEDAVHVYNSNGLQGPLGFDNITYNTSYGLIYPNPTSGDVYMEILNYTAELYALEIFNIKGQSVQKLILTNPKTLLNTDGFEPGCYFFKLTSSSTFPSTGKFVVGF